jgi:hypothetical protein
MARAKFDGIIEAVRYLPDGKIATVRAYERRGSVWSDDILLTRADLLTKLEQGKKFVIGRRKTYQGSMFETAQPVYQIKGHIVLESQSTGRDHLPGVPVF